MVCCSRPCIVKGEGWARINGTVSAVRTVPKAVGQVDGFKPGCGVAISIIDGSVDKTRPGRADEEQKREEPEDGSSDGHVSQSGERPFRRRGLGVRGSKGGPCRAVREMRSRAKRTYFYVTVLGHCRGTVAPPPRDILIKAVKCIVYCILSFLDHDIPKP